MSNEEMNKVTGNKEVFQKLLEDSLTDRRNDISHLRNVVLALCFVIMFLIVGFVIVVLHCQNVVRQVDRESQERMYNFLSEYDFETQIQLDTNHIVDSDHTGNIFLAR